MREVTKNLNYVTVALTTPCKKAQADDKQLNLERKCSQWGSGPQVEDVFSVYSRGMDQQMVVMYRFALEKLSF